MKEKKVEKELWGKENGLLLFISNEDINDIIKIINPLEYLGLLINGANETVKHGMEKHKGGFLGALLAPLAASLV